MRRVFTSLMLVVLLTGVLVMMGPAPVGSATSFPLEECARGCFSTEEDFVMQKSEPYDGNPYISDGDLLSFSGKVCARNADLLSRYYDGRPPADLGLDAVDVLDIEARLVAFSTELDDPRGRFTAGDLLFTSGGVIPNRALVYPFGISYDVGLDALQFRGEASRIISFVSAVPTLCPNGWPGCLQQELKRYGIDIWFSIEGTVMRAGAPSILDGYVLEASTGTIVAKQDALLPADVPADIPQRGVDFGLDALAVPIMLTQQAPLYFSTEILYRGKETPFTDGDVLRMGDGVVLRNENAIAAFYPAADFLGLDALDVGMVVEEREPRITHIGPIAVTDINGGTVPVGGVGNGLGSYVAYNRPFGGMIPIYGEIPSGITKFRVVYRKAGDPRPASPATATGIAVVPADGWKVEDWSWLNSDCSDWTPYASDANGWFDTSEYRRLAFGEGMPADCTAQLPLTVWNSQGSGVDSAGHYVVWLQWEQGGTIYEEPYDHHVQFDNEEPKNLQLSIPGGACASYGPTDMPIMVQGHFDDAYFWRYRLKIFGGNPPAAHYYGIVNYDDSAVDNVGPTGTGAGLKDLHTVNVNDLPAASVVECAYGLRLWVEDLTIHCGYNLPVNSFPWGLGYENATEITFDYTP